MSDLASLLSLNVGFPKDVPWQGRTVHTGIWKYPVTGSRMVRRLNIDGDGQGDRGGHGGEQRAVLVYQSESYTHWRFHLDRDDLEFGQFGENFTVDGLADDEVCIGDRYRIGTAEFEVTQPRVTCYRVGMRLREPTMPSLLVSHHRPGFYLRVVTEGRVEAGNEIVRTRIGPHALSVAAVDALLYLPDRDLDQLRQAVDIPALSPGWLASFRELLDAAETTSGIASPVGIEPAWSGFRRLRITRLVEETATVTSIYLAAEGGAALPRPEPGEFITLRLADAGDPAPVRSYSLSAGPETAGYRISVKRESHGLVSGYLHAQLRVGGTLEVAAPRGDFTLSAGDSPVLLISAGIGVTPVLSMLHHLASGAGEREVWWIHTARDAGRYAFAAEAHGLIASLVHGREHVFYTGPDAEIDGTEGAVVRGRLDRAALEGLGVPTDATAYICGPDGFTLAIRDALIDLGLRPDEVRSERFGALPAVNPGIAQLSRPLPHQPPGDTGDGPLISFARSGLSVRWSKQYPALLELAEACDLPTRWSCRTGVCHTCVTALLSGTVAYSPDPLELPIPSTTLLCCAQPTSDLVLDL